MAQMGQTADLVLCQLCYSFQLLAVSDLLDRTRAKVSEMQDRSAQAVEEQHINAHGCPVTRVNLDPKDNVILNVGELITKPSSAPARRCDRCIGELSL